MYSSNIFCESVRPAPYWLGCYSKILSALLYFLLHHLILFYVILTYSLSLIHVLFCQLDLEPLAFRALSPLALPFSFWFSFSYLPCFLYISYWLLAYFNTLRFVWILRVYMPFSKDGSKYFHMSPPCVYHTTKFIVGSERDAGLAPHGNWEARLWCCVALSLVVA